LPWTPSVWLRWPQITSSGNVILFAGFEIGLVHLEIASRAGAVVGARALDRLPIEAADVFGKGLGVEEAEPIPGATASSP